MALALLIGATGPTGVAVFEEAEARGLAIRGLARDPARLRAAVPRLRDVAKGDVLDTASLVAALAGVDAVISVLGTPLTRQPVTLLSAGTRHLLEAMRQTGVRRLVCVTGMGAGDSRGHGGFLYDRLILPLMLSTIYADKDRQEQVVRESDAAWTLVRPARLTNGARTRAYRALTQLAGVRMTTISRRDVADFLVTETLEGRYVRQTVNLTQ